MFSSDHDFKYKPKILIQSVFIIIFYEFYNFGLYSPLTQELIQF